ncbi:hypothetical protein DEU56DRAFT_176011 [Suillus clintonianus]|uniref:uncharacterized protein n=1 Tax=Suillus clintonianus TaxID=1904413 RepID=UPI001B879803|nr:uncharacterized protein DEU56DRAFT_176011 [Suillus clintonianus]KAG2115528.1 hypothetical protein DEU56DRAFT_176011 [Suillus clintonianus]
MALVISWPAVVALRAVSSGFLVLGLVLTIFRLTYRVWLRRFWVEDAWAGIAFLCGIAALTSCWTYVDGAGEEVIISFWVYSFAFPSVVWAVRQSILFSIVRIVYETQHLRHMILGLAGLFLGLWAGLVAQKAWQYGHDTTWYHTATTGKVHAFMTRPMVAFELMSDCLSDTILVALPLRLLWSLKLPKRQKRMIFAIFSSSIIVTIISIFRGICQIAKYTTVLPTATDFETSLSLLVCNLLVVVTFLYRIFGFVGADDEVSSDGDDYTTRTTAREVFTTVDLDDPGSSEATSRESQGCNPKGEKTLDTV